MESRGANDTKVKRESMVMARLSLLSRGRSPQSNGEALSGEGQRSECQKSESIE